MSESGAVYDEGEVEKITFADSFSFSRDPFSANKLNTSIIYRHQTHHWTNSNCKWHAVLSIGLARLASTFAHQPFALLAGGNRKCVQTTRHYKIKCKLNHFTGHTFALRIVWMHPLCREVFSFCHLFSRWLSLIMRSLNFYDRNKNLSEDVMRRSLSLYSHNEI